LARLVQELNRLPGIGPKSAQRLAYYIIRLPDEEAYALADAVTSVKQNIVFCEECQNLTDASPCQLCSDPRRDQTIICVVEEPLDVLAMERTRSFRGLYHVLHGVISPINGIGPEAGRFCIPPIGDPLGRTLEKSRISILSRCTFSKAASSQISRPLAQPSRESGIENHMTFFESGPYLCFASRVDS